MHPLDNSLAYRLWQRPFADRKLAPILAHNDMAKVRRVLDVGCGPGTNTRYFASTEYLGVDMNSSYIADARARHGRDFLVADVTTYTAPPGAAYDFILSNSFLHHIDTPDVRRILRHLATLLTPDGHLHLLDLVLPPKPSVGRLLARLDRGDHARPLDTWRMLIEEVLEPVLVEPYALTGFGVPLWNMVYIKARRRT
jgi:SAM-dependent methyltransferase